MSQRDEIARDILSSRPEGHFAAVLPLVSAYAGLMAEMIELYRRLNRIPVGDPRGHKLLEQICDRGQQASDLFDVLALGPHNRHLPPPRLQ